jgi:hypothetical protein
LETGAPRVPHSPKTDFNPKTGLTRTPFAESSASAHCFLRSTNHKVRLGMSHKARLLKAFAKGAQSQSRFSGFSHNFACN